MCMGTSDRLDLAGRGLQARRLALGREALSHVSLGLGEQ